MPDVEEVIDAELTYKFACSDYDVRKFVSAALEGLDGMDGLADELLAAVDEAERTSGRELDGENDKGWEVGGRGAGRGAGGARSFLGTAGGGPRRGVRHGVCAQSCLCWGAAAGRARGWGAG